MAATKTSKPVADR